jgi:hypothetical protein
MTTKTTSPEKPVAIVCAECGRELECCAFCEREDCSAASCYSCLVVALRQSTKLLHLHGG